MARLLIPSFLLAVYGLIPAKAQTDLPTWPQEPDGFKGVQFGWTEKQAKSQMHWGRNACFLFKGRLGCKAAIDGGGFTIATRFNFDASGFIFATGDFPSEDYEAVRDMFIGKYGQPYNIAESEVQNRMGATFQQERLLWIGQRVEISMSRYGSTISEGFFMIGAIAAFAQDLDNEKATREKALQ